MKGKITRRARAREKNNLENPRIWLPKVNVPIKSRKRKSAHSAHAHSQTRKQRHTHNPFYFFVTFVFIVAMYPDAKMSIRHFGSSPLWLTAPAVAQPKCVCRHTTSQRHAVIFFSALAPPYLTRRKCWRAIFFFFFLLFVEASCSRAMLYELRLRCPWMIFYFGDEKKKRSVTSAQTENSYSFGLFRASHHNHAHLNGRTAWTDVLCTHSFILHIAADCWLRSVLFTYVFN